MFSFSPSTGFGLRGLPTLASASSMVARNCWSRFLDTKLKSSRCSRKRSILAKKSAFLVPFLTLTPL